MILQAILVTMIMLLDTGRCWKSTKCGDQAIPFPFRTSSGCNLDHSSPVACNYSYKPHKRFSNLGSMDAYEMLHDGNSNVAGHYCSGSQVNDSASLSKFSTSGPTISRRPSNYYLIGYSIPAGFLIPLDLGWPVANLSCHEARKNASSFECRSTNSECVDSRIGAGYHCQCLTGFKGNPYLVDGCHDIDECAESEPCEGTCTNLIGSYSCSCPRRFEGDGKKDGSGCYPQRQTSRFILFYIFLGFVVPTFGVSWIFWQRKQKKAVKLRRSLFIRNGGELLEAKQPALLIFTAEDLKKVTNNYDENNVLCQKGHLGFTYKGLLPGLNCSVTIQFCHAFDRCKVETLITKLVALSQISHRNAVKLLGCCLETQIPLLVYESITHETLLDHINDDSLPWDTRLRIAADTAGALACLHSATIIHGDLNTSCILLENGYNVKLKGFDLTCLECSCVEFYGDMSIYLDPDFLSSGRLTEKSDVYSFGFVLVELLTRKGVMSPEEEENLVKYILGPSREGSLLEILDDSIATDGNAGKRREVAEIAKICLSTSSHERPNMKEVAIALECIMIRD